MHKYHVEIVIVPHNKTHTTSRLSFPLEETTFITIMSHYKNPDLKILKNHTKTWEKGSVSKATLYQRLQIPHSLPACNSLNFSSPTFSQLGSSIPPPPSPLLPLPISSNLLPPSFILHSQLNSSIPQPSFSLPQLDPTFSQLGSAIPSPPSPLLPLPVSSNLLPSSSLLLSQLNSSIPQPSFSLPQQDISIPPQPSFQLPYQLNLPTRSLVTPLLPLMEQSSVASSLTDPATSLPESQDM